MASSSPGLPPLRYPKLAADSVLKKDTKLLVPQLPTVEQAKASCVGDHARFYTVPAPLKSPKIPSDFPRTPASSRRSRYGAVHEEIGLLRLHL